MKKSLFATTIIFLSLIHCMMAKPIIIKGHIFNDQGDTLFLHVSKSPIDFIDYDLRKMTVASTKPDAKGFFRMSYNINEGYYFNLSTSFGNQVFGGSFLLPGDSVYIEIVDTEFNGMKFPKTHFYGSASKIIIYQEELFKKGFYNYLDKYNLSKDSFIGLIDSVALEGNKLLEKTSLEQNWPSELVEQVRLNSSYNWKNEKLVYIWAHKRRYGKPGDVIVDPDYFNFIVPEDLDNQKALNEYNYYRFLREYPQDLAMEKWGHLSADGRNAWQNEAERFEMLCRVHMIDSLFKGQVREYAYAVFINDMFSELNNGSEPLKKARIKCMDSLLQVIMPEKDKIYGSIYERLIAKRDKALSLENTAVPPFTFMNINGSTVSLSDYKGKVLLLDFWAIGCKPCMDAIPSSNELQDDMAGKDFALIPICAKISDKFWKSIIEKYQWHGIHLMSPNDADIRSTYAFDGYPHYVIVDKKGIIRNSDASRDNDILKKEIENLLKE